MWLTRISQQNQRPRRRPRHPAEKTRGLPACRAIWRSGTARGSRKREQGRRRKRPSLLADRTAAAEEGKDWFLADLGAACLWTEALRGHSLRPRMCAVCRRERGRLDTPELASCSFHTSHTLCASELGPRRRTGQGARIADDAVAVAALRRTGKKKARRGHIECRA